MFKYRYHSYNIIQLNSNMAFSQFKIVFKYGKLCNVIENLINALVIYSDYSIDCLI